jgi:hypothetical protein
VPGEHLILDWPAEAECRFCRPAHLRSMVRDRCGLVDRASHEVDERLQFERLCLNRFPRDVPPGDLLASFTLSDADLDLIGDRRRAAAAGKPQARICPRSGTVPIDGLWVHHRVTRRVAVRTTRVR